MHRDQGDKIKNRNPKYQDFYFEIKKFKNMSEAKKALK